MAAFLAAMQVSAVSYKLPKTPAMRVSPNAADNAWLSANPNFAPLSAVGSGTSLPTDTRFQTVRLVAEAGFTPARQEVAGQALWIVTIPNLQPNVEVTWSGLPDGFTPLKTISGADGTARLTLPDGIYDFTSTANGTTIRWTAHVNGANTVAYPYNLTGVSVNGVDLAFLAGNGWSYSPDNQMATLSGAGPFMVTGSSTSIGITAASCSVMVSNLTLRLGGVSRKSPFRVADGAFVTLALEGTNVFVGGNEAAGLRVGSGQWLAIGGRGSLEATGGDTAAGIGGSYQEEGGTISIAGGTIRATGGFNGAGIGGGGEAGGTINISDGTIFAQGGTYGAGIGGGRGGAGTITISGGVIKSAKGGQYGAGIGVGGNFSSGTITITGGVIESAQGGTDAAGIGNGQGRTYIRDTTITISGGVIKNAQGGTGAAGIGGGRCGSMASVTISGGTVIPVAGSGSPCAIGCAATDDAIITEMGTVTVTGGSIMTEATAFRPAATNALNEGVQPLNISGFMPDAAVEMKGLTTLTAAYGKKDIHADSQGRIRLWLPPDEHCFNLNDRHCTIDMGSGATSTTVKSGVGVSVNGVDISAGSGAGWSYFDLVLTMTPEYPRARYTVSGSTTDGFVRMVADASGTVVLSNLTVRTQRLERIPLDLAQGVWLELVLQGTNYLAAPLHVPGIHCPAGRTLTISGTGSLNVWGGHACAAIGGSGEESGGAINVAGGTIGATGGVYGAGIGGGMNGTGGTIRITGGTVNAVSLYAGAGIGGGANGDGGSIFISGGMVSAQGRDESAGIGGGGAIGDGAIGGTGGYGRGGAGGTIDISGGIVTATGAGMGAGIGGGGGSSTYSNGGTGGTISISGGEVTATGGDYSVGIGGGGYNAESGDITISGGHITAHGGPNEPGIGGGTLTEDGSVTIMGGTVFLDDVPTSIGNGRSATEGGQSFSTTFTGGAIYTIRDALRPYADDDAGSWVYPVDFPIERPLTEIESASFANNPAYGTADLMTDTNGNLRVWFPPSGSTEFQIAAIRPQGGPTLYFGYNIDPSGNPTVRDSVLFVNGTSVVGGQSQTGTGWSYNGDSGALTLLDDGNYTISGTSRNGDFQLFAAASPSVTISDLVLRTNAKYASAFVVSNACTLTLASVNGLGALGQYAAGIQVCSNATLTITGTGGLAAQGGKGAAGIGSSGGYTPSGQIIIESGTIVATGGEKGAGIGGGQSANLTADNIIITGGDITATGGKNAAGIGAGYGTKTIPSGAVRISGGTILAMKGSSANASNIGDFIASGNAVAVTGERADTSCVITGGSVHGANLMAKPTPVDATGTPLRYLLVTGLTPGETVQIESDDIPADYGMNDVVADDTGSICLWLPVTNIERVVTVNGAYFAVNSSVNKAIDATSGSDLPPDKLRRNGSDFWRVTLPYFKPGAAITLAGLEPHATSAKVETDGNAYIFLPDGEYAFTVDGRPWTVSVARAPAVAHRVTGVLVGGEEAGTLLGDGWTYDFTNGVLTLDGEDTDFVLSGTNTEGHVRVSALAAASVTLSNLSLVTCSNSPTIALNPGTTLRLLLEGANTISSTNWVWRNSAPAIFVPAGATLRINATNSPCGSLVTRGGHGCAAIGGKYMGQTNTGTIIIEGGEINATGGFHGAAIGGGWYGDGGTISIYGGLVTATSGDYPNISNDNSSAIGGGFGQAGTAPAYTQSGGTVVAYGSRNDIGGNTSRSGSSVLITGGSLRLAGRGIAIPAPSNAVERVLCVTITNLPPNASVEDLIIKSASKLVDYGDSDLVADGEGRLYLWLPGDNPYDFTRANGEEWHVEVAGTNVVATFGPRVLSLETLRIESITVTDDAIRLVVSAVPVEWLADNTKSLRVRAASALPLPTGDDALLAGVTAELNRDGTVTITLPRTTDTSRFFRVEGE